MIPAAYICLVQDCVPRTTEDWLALIGLLVVIAILCVLGERWKHR